MEDILGKAVLEYFIKGESQVIELMVNGIEDDPIEPSVFLRTIDEMDEMEIAAIDLAKGNCLDVGAGAGVHTRVLQDRGFDVMAVEQSEHLCEVMKNSGIKSFSHTTIEDLPIAKFDTIFLLMNGWGIARNIKGLPSFIQKLKSLLNDGGQIIGDHTSLHYLEELAKDGEKVPEEIIYEMKWKGESETIEWMYPSLESIKKAAENCDLEMSILASDEYARSLVRLSAL